MLALAQRKFFIRPAGAHDPVESKAAVAGVKQSGQQETQGRPSPPGCHGFSQDRTGRRGGSGIPNHGHPSSGGFCALGPARRVGIRIERGVGIACVWRRNNGRAAVIVSPDVEKTPTRQRDTRHMDAQPSKNQTIKERGTAQSRAAWPCIKKRAHWVAARLLEEKTLNGGHENNNPSFPAILTARRKSPKHGRLN